VATDRDVAGSGCGRHLRLRMTAWKTSGSGDDDAGTPTVAVPMGQTSCTCGAPLRKAAGGPRTRSQGAGPRAGLGRGCPTGGGALIAAPTCIPPHFNGYPAILVRLGGSGSRVGGLVVGLASGARRLAATYRPTIHSRLGRTGKPFAAGVPTTAGSLTSTYACHASKCQLSTS
jgi:hypothetical protein